HQRQGGTADLRDPTHPQRQPAISQGVHEKQKGRPACCPFCFAENKTKLSHRVVVSTPTKQYRILGWTCPKFPRPGICNTRFHVFAMTCSSTSSASRG